MLRPVIGAATIVVMLATGAVAAAAPATERVTVSSAGRPANAASWGASPSADGSVVAFVSQATNLVPRDRNHRVDVFVRDRVAGVTRRISVGRGGREANRRSSAAILSDDGRVVAFESAATNLRRSRADRNGVVDVFVHDRTTGRTSLASQTSRGVQFRRETRVLDVSPKGRYVLFMTTDERTLWLRDRILRTTRRLVEVPGGLRRPTVDGGRIAAGGRFVVVAASDDGIAGVYVLDRRTGDSVAPDTCVCVLELADATADGRYVLMHASGLEEQLFAADLLWDRVSGSTLDVTPAHALSAGATHVLFRQRGRVYRRTLVGGEVLLVSATAIGGRVRTVAGEDTISADGRYGAFATAADDVVPGDVGGIQDVYVRGPLP